MESFKRHMFQASILVVLLFMTPSNAKVLSANINTVCMKSSIPAYCLELLGSTPEAATANLKGLANITLSLANSNAVKTLAQLNSLIAKTTSAKLQLGYKSCSRHIYNTIGVLQDSEADLSKRDYSGMNVQASAAMSGVAHCVSETKDLAVDSSIKKGCQDLDKICRIILAISNLL